MRTISRLIGCLVFGIVLGVVYHSFDDNDVNQYTQIDTTAIIPDGVEYITDVGRAPFGLTSPKFMCRDFLRSLDNLDTIHIAFLYNTFGNNFDCLKTILQDPRLHVLEVQ